MKEDVLKVGDRIRVLKKPKSWASLLNENCPLGLKFPYDLTIKQIKFDDNYTALTCGDYGWSLESVIKAGYEILNSEYTPKQGDKVLVSNNSKYCVEAEFIIKHEDNFIVKIGNVYTNHKNIKPYEEEIKVGDWVKNTDEKELILVTKDMNLKCLNNESEYIKITNPELIKLLNNEL